MSNLLYITYLNNLSFVIAGSLPRGYLEPSSDSASIVFFNIFFHIFLTKFSSSFSNDNYHFSVFNSNRSRCHCIKESLPLSKHTIIEIVHTTKVQSQTLKLSSIEGVTHMCNSFVGIVYVYTYT